MLRIAVLLCAVACAKPAPRVLPAPGEPLGFEFRLDALRRTATARPPESVGRSMIFVKSRMYVPPAGALGEERASRDGVDVSCTRDTDQLVVSVGVDPGEADLVPGEQVFDCPEVLPGVPIVVRFAEAP